MAAIIQYLSTEKAKVIMKDLRDAKRDDASTS
jgi:hypothetical protein